ncbi:MAG: protein-L-isoaspartate O-methyltransferase family protein [Bdellovibrionales bacterium]
MNFKQARKAMVESQLMPNGITNRLLLDTFLNISRESFFPEPYKSTCYKDENITLPDGRIIIEPLGIAKLIEAANISKKEVVLCMGDISGYSSAIVSHLASTVIRIEQDAHALVFSESIYKELGIMNIVSIEGAIAHGDARHAPFDKIILCGASHKQPDHLIEQLSYGGALCYIHKENPLSLGEIRKVTRKNAQDIEITTIGTSPIPYCVGYEPIKEFSF